MLFSVFSVPLWRAVLKNSSPSQTRLHMKSLWDSSARQELSQRLDKLKPDAPAQWGRMTAPQMVVHVVDALKMSTGELPIEEKKRPVRFAPLKQLIIYGPPFPKSVPTAPELLVRQCEDFGTECTNLKQMMDTFAGIPATTELPRHPAFGKLSRRAWGALTYKHIDHHFKQFGI